MSKHTQEPWKVHQDASGDVFISSAKTSFHIAEIGSEDDETVIPDARRIVACVNACRGLPTDELEQKGLVAAVGTQLLDADELIVQARSQASIWKARATTEANISRDLKQQFAELLEAQQDHHRLVRELDVLLNGVDGAAPQASLCDLVAQLKSKGGAA